MSAVKIAAIIPARLASTRFPNKPLLEIEGLPMIEHVRRRALLCDSFSSVVVATCDEAIAAVIRSFGGEVVMTSARHQVATERIIEAMEQIECTHIVNIQGDEILVLPSDLSRIVCAIRENPEWDVWNAVAEIKKEEELEELSIVKCALSVSGRIFWFSRRCPGYSFPDNPGDLGQVYWVMGLLAYSRKILGCFRGFRRARLEEMESIEQVRFLENDISVFSVCLEKAYPGINEPREVPLVKKYLAEDVKQREVLGMILR